jgi:hypothetical protein
MIQITPAGGQGILRKFFILCQLCGALKKERKYIAFGTCQKNALYINLPSGGYYAFIKMAKNTLLINMQINLKSAQFILQIYLLASLEDIHLIQLHKRFCVTSQFRLPNSNAGYISLNNFERKVCRAEKAFTVFPR